MQGTRGGILVWVQRRSPQFVPRTPTVFPGTVLSPGHTARRNHKQTWLGGMDTAEKDEAGDAHGAWRSRPVFAKGSKTSDGYTVGRNRRTCPAPEQQIPMKDAEQPCGQAPWERPEPRAARCGAAVPPGLAPLAGTTASRFPPLAPPKPPSSLLANGLAFDFTEKTEITRRDCPHAPTPPAAELSPSSLRPKPRCAPDPTPLPASLRYQQLAYR